jgi:hypothetical protein
MERTLNFLVNYFSGEREELPSCVIARVHEKGLNELCAFYLEEYENCDGQLSDIKDYSVFLSRIGRCITNVKRVLKPGGFSCWVVGDWRDSGGYKMFTHDVINQFRGQGFIPHDTVIIKNNSPFAAFQAYKCACKRITSKIHETIVVFRKPGELDLSGLVKDEINEKANEFFT